MSYPEYESDVLRTLSLQFNVQDSGGGPYPSAAQLLRLLEEAISLGERADSLKRSIFYGSIYTEADDGPASGGIEYYLGGSGGQEEYPSPEMIHSALGIFTEAAELLHAIVQSTFEGQAFDRINAVEELGDLEWYMAVLRDRLGVSQEEIQRKNIAKRRARYPERFEKHEALNRDLEKERSELS
jgi:NTP pyrophosphatase (non-canonical NTP hydrolase)